MALSPLHETGVPLAAAEIPPIDLKPARTPPPSRTPRHFAAMTSGSAAVHARKMPCHSSVSSDTGNLLGPALHSRAIRSGVRLRALHYIAPHCADGPQGPGALLSTAARGSRALSACGKKAGGFRPLEPPISRAKPAAAAFRQPGCLVIPAVRFESNPCFKAAVAKSPAGRFAPSGRSGCAGCPSLGSCHSQHDALWPALRGSRASSFVLGSGGPPACCAWHCASCAIHRRKITNATTCAFMLLTVSLAPLIS